MNIMIGRQKDISIQEWYIDLYTRIEKDPYSSSFVDYEFELSLESELYKAFKSYKDINDPLITNFMKTYTNICIKKIDTIYIMPQLVENEDGSRGCYKNGLFTLRFTVKYAKLR